MAKQLGQGKVSPDIRNKLIGSKGTIVSSTPGLKLRLALIERIDSQLQQTREPTFDESTGKWQGDLEVVRSGVYQETSLTWIVEVQPCEGPSLDSYTKAMDAILDHVDEMDESNSYIREPQRSGAFCEVTNVSYVHGYDPTESTTDPASSGIERPDTGYYIIHQIWR